MSDEEAIKLIKANNTSGFDFLYDKYSRLMYSYMYRMIGNGSEVEDLTSEVFFKIYKNIKKYRESGKFKSFIYRIAHNTAIDYLRRKKEVISYDDTIEIPVENEVLFSNEEKNTLMIGLNNLKQSDREILIMFYYDQLQIKEISSIIKKSVSAVKVALSRARERLKKEVVYEK